MDAWHNVMIVVLVGGLIAAAWGWIQPSRAEIPVGVIFFYDGEARVLNADGDRLDRYSNGTHYDAIEKLILDGYRMEDLEINGWPHLGRLTSSTKEPKKPCGGKCSIFCGCHDAMPQGGTGTEKQKRSEGDHA